MKFNTLLWEVDAGILTLTLNRPDQMNSFTVEMANELIAAFGAASEDDSVRAIVVTGAGRAFCAGMDLSRVRAMCSACKRRSSRLWMICAID